MKNSRILVVFLTVLILASCQKEQVETQATKPADKITSVQQTSDDVQEQAKEPKKPYANYVNLSGSPEWQTSGHLGRKEWMGWSIPKDWVNSQGGEVAFMLNVLSGDADLYIYSADWYRIKSSTQGGQSSELLYLTSSEFGNSSYVYLYVYGYTGATYKLKIYGNSSNNNGGGGTANSSYPSTNLATSNGSPSGVYYATSGNVFTGNLKGECTWYVYGRVMELVDAGYIRQSEGTKLYNALHIAGGRHAKNWPNKIGGDWMTTSSSYLPNSKRKRGMIVVWKNNSDMYGHVGFVEEVSANKKKYLVSEFNYVSHHTYSTKWFDFEGDDRRSLTNGTLSDYPQFLYLRP